MKFACTLFLLFIAGGSFAQLCQGSLGDPIINITFGSGNNPGSPVNAAATGYGYVPGDCPADGYYTVRNNSTACFTNSWHNVSQDHTGNSNGYFMLVNASLQPSDFYVDTVRGLCQNTTYEFAAWIMNVIRPESCSGNSNQPNLTFKIEKTDGTLLQSYNTNNLPPLSSPTWKQYGFFFTTASANPVIILRITNNAAGGCGNDLALDDITFRPCGPLLIPAIVGQSATSVSLCQGTADVFNFVCQVSGGFAMPAYQWQENLNQTSWIDIPGETLSTLTRNFPAATPVGVYAYRLAVTEAGNLGSLQCRIASQALTVTVTANPVTAVSNNNPVCSGKVAILTSSGGSTYQWNGPGSYTGSGSPLYINAVQQSQQGKYYVLVKNEAGCEHLDSTVVIVDPSPVATTSFNAAKICPSDSVMLSAAGGISYEWQPATGLSSPNVSSPTASPADDTHYQAIVFNSFNCTDTAYIDIDVLEPPHVNAGPDKAMLQNEPTILEASVTGDNFTYSWVASPFINNTAVLQPMVNPPLDTKFILNANSLSGCGSSSDTVKVFVYKDVFIPGAFSPNDDGTNDTWYIPALNAFKEYELSVFDRYGEKVFYLKNENRRWDGKFHKRQLPVGVYVYLLVIKRYINPLKGSVLLIR